MGRKKRSVISMTIRNKKVVSHRWNRSESQSKVQSVGSNVSIRPCLVDHLISEENIEIEVDPNDCPYPDEPKNTPTGFALYNSYRPNDFIEADESAPTYAIIDVDILKSFITQFPCSSCLQRSVCVENVKTLGYSTSLMVQCINCGEEYPVNLSRRVSGQASGKTPFDVNRRVVQAFSSLGKGHRGLEVFSMNLNMKPMTINAYQFHRKEICRNTKKIVETSLDQARTEVRKYYAELDEVLPAKPIEVCVSFDGSWQKRGFTSKYGVGCCIEVITGLVIDFHVASKYCRLCETKKKQLNAEEFEAWEILHKPMCQRNYEGSSPAMEMAISEELWKRSEDFGMQYTKMVSDGDGKSYAHVSSMEIYPGKEIEKIECLNHVAKRLGTGLRTIVRNNRGKGDPLGGKAYGSLKDTTINKLTNYYRNAVQNNLDCVVKMRKAIFATIYHCVSTDVKPKHGLCPEGAESWCFYQRAIANKQIPEKHIEKVKTPLSQKVLDAIIPLYKRLTSDNLLNRCVAGKTQNANEALHGVIWSKCAKTTFVSKYTLEAAVGTAVFEYNCGRLKTILEMQKADGTSPGKHTMSIAKKIDQKRLKLAEKRKSSKYAEYKRKKRYALLQEEERLKKKEGVTYGPGEF